MKTAKTLFNLLFVIILCFPAYGQNKKIRQLDYYTWQLEIEEYDSLYQNDVTAVVHDSFTINDMLLQYNIRIVEIDEDTSLEGSSLNDNNCCLVSIDSIISIIGFSTNINDSMANCISSDQKACFVSHYDPSIIMDVNQSRVVHLYTSASKGAKHLYFTIITSIKLEDSEFDYQYFFVLEIN